MNRNVEEHFAQLPDIDINRSIFDRSSTHKTSFNVGELIPFYIDEVLPGDTFKVTTSKVIRLQTLLTPVMDNLYLDTYYFFVPNRLVWNHWKEFMGENTASAWVPQVTYQIPSISAPSGGFATGTIADYFGLPVGVDWSNQSERRPSALPFRGYALICNEFFRDENLTDPLNIPKGDSSQTGTNGSNYVNDVANGGMPFKVAKYHDYFTSALPSPQKGPAVSIFSQASVPVVPGSVHPTPDYYNPVLWESANGHSSKIWNYALQAGSQPKQWKGVMDYNNEISSTYIDEIYPTNLWANLSGVTGFSINELRLAFQLQKYYEKNARGGTRYTEIVRSHFGVTSPDSRLQRPEYLGGNRVPVIIHEVTNTAQSQNDFLGDLGAMSVTSNINEDFNHSFCEHGYVIGVCCLRYDHSYPQGLEKFWTRRKTTDFYLPVFANIGEQPVFQDEIFASSSNMTTPVVFGFQEAWADYRYKPDRVSGEMRPGITNSLSSWHFSDYYQTAPTLSDSWIREDKTNVDRTLAVTSAVANQAFMDVFIKNICTRPMPVYSIPGLIDHH